MTDNYDIQNVSKEDMGALYNGDMRLTPNGLSYKNRATGKVFQLSNDDIETVGQNFMANKPGLRIMTKDGDLHRFANFTEGQMNKVKTYIATKWRRNVDVMENTLKGWNFGSTDIDGKNLQFKVGETLGFEIPLSNVSNCTANKSEAIVELHPNEDSAVGLVEMRFHIPMLEGVAEEESPAELFRQAVMKFAAVEAESEQPIVLLTNMLCLTPRGRYDIKIFPTFLSFHGKTYDYKITARSVNRLFMLKHKDGRRQFFVMHINPPIRQGQTRYPYIVFEFNNDDYAELELSLTEEQLKKDYEGKIEKHLSGPTFNIVAKLFRVFVGIKVTVPGGFNLKDNTEAVTCSHKQSHGFLYPMDKGFMYVPKPPIYIRFEEISNVNFARSDVSTKTFDLEMSVKSGASFTFSSVGKDDFDPLLQFCKEKNLPVHNVKNLAKAKVDKFAGSDDEVDPYKERLKSEAAAADSDESDSDEEDEDFDVEQEEKKRKQKADDDSEATDGTEPDEEYDTASDADDDDEPKEKKSKSHGEKKSKKDKSERSSSKKDKSGGKKKKDPNAPKRPTSAYFQWMNEIRSSITKPGMGVAEVAKEAGRLWKEMGEAAKKPYEEKAKVDKERYDREMKAYKASGGGAASSSGKSSSTPKKASSSAANTSKSSPNKAAKSREFLSSSDEDSSDSDKNDDDKKKKQSKSSKKEEKKDKASSSKKKAKTPSSSEEKSSDESSDDSD